MNTIRAFRFLSIPILLLLIGMKGNTMDNDTKYIPAKSDAPVILWDMDGTIAASMEAAFQSYNELADSMGLRKMKPEDVEELKNVGVWEMLKRHKVPMVKIPYIAYKVLYAMRTKIDSVNPILGMPEVLRKIKNSGYRMGILTSNNEENLLRFLNNHGLEDIFEFHHCGSHLFGKHGSIKEVIKKYNLNPNKTYYVGDEVRDIEAANKVKGVKIISVSWGFSTHALLEQHNPDFLADNPSELLCFLESKKFSVNTKISGTSAQRRA